MQCECKCSFDAMGHSESDSDVWEVGHESGAGLTGTRPDDDMRADLRLGSDSAQGSHESA